MCALPPHLGYFPRPCCSQCLLATDLSAEQSWQHVKTSLYIISVSHSRHTCRGGYSIRISPRQNGKNLVCLSIASSFTYFLSSSLLISVLLTQSVVSTLQQRWQVRISVRPSCTPQNNLINGSRYTHRGLQVSCGFQVKSIYYSIMFS